MRIAICDDEECFVKSVYDTLWHQLDYHVDTFLNPEELLQKYGAGETYDVIFCDIMMEPYNGIEVGRQIRALDSNVILIYLTSNLEYAPLGYEVRAFRYLLKPVTKEALLLTMEEVKKELHQPAKILLETSVSSILVAQEDILYLEANDKDTHIFCEDDSYSLRKGLNEFDDTRLTLDNGITLSISRRKSKSFQQTFEQYLKGGF